MRQWILESAIPRLPLLSFRLWPRLTPETVPLGSALRSPRAVSGKDQTHEFAEKKRKSGFCPTYKITGGDFGAFEPGSVPWLAEIGCRSL